ncbi:DUF924 family protein [Roseibium sp.]|uniref:DUF924 family protein n=2 Tax=Roseibium sp. TaxID=1936156 RepID=UPI003D0BE7E7
MEKQSFAGTEYDLMTDQPITPSDVLDFWWQAGSAKWFAGGDKFDEHCRDRFLPSIHDAISGRLDHWAESAAGSLALLLLLDQMTRNVFRGTPEAFSGDRKALTIAEQAIANGFDRAYPIVERYFYYLPFMHAEDIAPQEKCVDLCRTRGDKEAYHYALIHLDVIRRFGRFPHRNKVLGRETTAEEQAYLDDGGFSA